MLVAIFACSMAQAQTESEAFNAIINSIPAVNEELKGVTDPVSIQMSYDEANKAIVYIYTAKDYDTFANFVMSRNSVANGVIQGILQEYAKDDGLVNDFLNEYEKYGFKYVVRIRYIQSDGRGRQTEVEIDAKKARKIAKELGY